MYTIGIKTYGCLKLAFLAKVATHWKLYYRLGKKTEAARSSKLQHTENCMYRLETVAWPRPSRVGDSPTRRAKMRTKIRKVWEKSKNLIKIWGKIEGRRNLAHLGLQGWLLIRKQNPRRLGAQKLGCCLTSIPCFKLMVSLCYFCLYHHCLIHIESEDYIRSCNKLKKNHEFEVGCQNQT